MCFLFMSVASRVWSGSILPHSEGGTHTGGYAWYTFRRSCLVYIQAAMPGTHTGDHAWYTFRRLRVVHISTVNDTSSPNCFDKELLFMQDHTERQDSFERSGGVPVASWVRGMGTTMDSAVNNYPKITVSGNSFKEAKDQ